MSDPIWRERYAQDDVRRQKLQDREWLHSRQVRVGVFDAVVASVVFGAMIIGAV